MQLVFLLLLEDNNSYKDKIYLTDGTVIHGWIEEEGRNYLWIGTEKGYYDLDRSKCERIEENYLLRYMRKLI